jgi:hypothetical protein
LVSVERPRQPLTTPTAPLVGRNRRQRLGEQSGLRRRALVARRQRRLTEQALDPVTL